MERGHTERLLRAARRLDVTPGVLETVRAGLDEGRDAAWALQELLKRAELSPRQAAELQRELLSGEGEDPPSPPGGEVANPDPPVATRTQVETRELPARPPSTSRRTSARVQPGLLLGGRFRLEEEIGHGSQGIVFRARDQSLQRDVAVKVLRGDAPGSGRERFLREAQTVSRLRHPGIVLVYEAGEVGERGLYYAMELVRGRSLEDVLEEECPLAPERAVRVLEAVALAVHHAHDAGLVHRDLKPGNILLDEHEQPRIADFGLVTLAEGTRLTATRSVVGTPVYMAPEQAQGERVDRRADVYSLGAILYEALCGRPPFEGDTPLAIFRKVVEEDPRPLRQVNPALSEGLERVCLRALEKEPRSRYLTAAAFARDLRRALDGQALVSPAPRAVARRLRRGLRRAAPLGLGLLPFAGGLTLGLPLGALSRRPAPPPAPRPLAVEVTRPDPIRAARRADLLRLARSERGRGLPAATIDWLRALGPEELRHDGSAQPDLARARAVEALAWLDQEREDEARRALAEGWLWSPRDALLTAARGALLLRQGDRGLAQEELARARQADPGLPEVHQELARAAPNSLARLQALDAALALCSEEPWPTLLRDRARVHIERGELNAALHDVRRLVRQPLPPGGPEGPFGLERALALEDPAARRAAVAVQLQVEGRRALAQRALSLLPP